MRDGEAVAGVVSAPSSVVRLILSAQGESHAKRNAARKQAATVEQAHIQASLQKKLARTMAMKKKLARTMAIQTKDDDAKAAQAAAADRARALGASHYRAVARPSTSVLHRPDMDSKVALRMLPLMPGCTQSTIISCQDMVSVGKMHR